MPAAVVEHERGRARVCGRECMPAWPVESYGYVPSFMTLRPKF